MKQLTALMTFYDKDINPRKHVFRGETFLANDNKASQLIKRKYARAAGSADYEEKVVQPETKEDPSTSPDPIQEPETETKESGFDYSSFTVSELKEYMQQTGIEIPKDAKKADLIKAIYDYEKGDGVNG